MTDPVPTSGSRWEPFPAPRAALPRHATAGLVPSGPTERPEQLVDGRVVDSRPDAAPGSASPTARPGARRTAVLVAGAAGLLLLGGAGGYAAGHATAATAPAGIAGITEHHRAGAPDLGGRPGTAPRSGTGAGTSAGSGAATGSGPST